MQYNFDEPIDRSSNFAAKYDECAKKFGKEGLIPMWIADMDLKTAQPILDAIEERNKQGMFGYTSRPTSYFDAVCQWQLEHNGYAFDRSLAAFALGVIPALCTLIREFSEPGQEIMFFTPVYSEFEESVTNCDRKSLTVSLKEHNGYYEIDFAAFEEAAKRHPAFLIMCNPHNPVGRTWTREELEKVGNICLKYNIPIISDEIHSDLMLYGSRHTVMASVSKEIVGITVTCTSATKTFNLAGLQAATIFFPNHEMKNRFESFWSKMDVHRNNCFSLVAVEAAFRYGGEWLTQLLAYLESNIDYAWDYLKANIPEIHFRKPESTYLIWLDCRDLGLKGDALPKFMVEQAGLALNDGRSFGTEGAGYMRMNIACPRCTLEKALTQLKAAVDRHMGR
ncbi:MAG TPA: cystathionine beta-lyase, partial [Ruminiclostridium sp.]|nr:cystathionine beta-lyase [Ruminiclostridium sp.]